MDVDCFYVPMAMYLAGSFVPGKQAAAKRLFLFVILPPCSVLVPAPKRSSLFVFFIVMYRYRYCTLTDTKKIVLFCNFILMYSTVPVPAPKESSMFVILSPCTELVLVPPPKSSFLFVTLSYVQYQYRH